MTEIVRAARPVEFLRLVPRLVGFRPVESLVLVAFRGSRTHAAMRFDLPDTRDPAVLDAVTGHLVGMLCRVEEVDGVVPVVYTAAPIAAAPVPLVEILSGHAAAAGLDVKDAFCVAGDGWCRMPGGARHPLEELGADASDLLDPDAELRIPEVGAAERAAFASRLTAWRTRPDGPGGQVHGFSPAEPTAGAAFRRGEPFVARAAQGLDAGRLIEGMLTPHDGTDPCPCLAALAAFAEVPDLAEHLLLQIGWGAGFGERVRRAWLERDEDDPLAEAALSGGEIRRPSVDRIEAGLRAVRAALAHLDPEDRGPLAACTAWLEWALGRGSLAGAFVDLALAAGSRPPLAVVLAAKLRRGELPEWAFRAEPGLSLEAQLRRLA